jgi:hypothetical protein
MDFEVVPGAVRSGGGELIAMSERLRGDGPPPDAAGDPGWAATAGGATLAVAVDAALAGSARRARDLGAALRAAADAYETADEQAARRLRW